MPNTDNNSSEIEFESYPLFVGTLSYRFIQAARRAVASTSTSSSAINCELDSHADTCVAGSNFVMLEEADSYISVYPYSDEYPAINNIPIASVATAWTHPTTGRTYLLVFHQALYFGTRMNHSLICPNQLRANGITVSDAPRQFDFKSTHSISVPFEHGTVEIPIGMKGIMSGFDTYLPSTADLEALPRLIMTSTAPWDPHSNSYP